MSNIENSATEIAYFNTDADEKFAEDYIKDLDNITVFRDEIKKNLKNAGFFGNMDSTNEIVEFLCDCCKKELHGDFENPNDKSHCIKLNKKTLKKLIEYGVVTLINNLSREFMYKLCFALKMDEKSAEAFFYKGFFERPFNFKDIHEAVYYFCLKNNKSYNDALKIINEIENSTEEQNSDADELTAIIAGNIKKIKTEDELKEYIIHNKSGFTKCNNTVYSVIDDLLDKCKKLAKDESEKYSTENKTSNHDDKPLSIDEMLSVIYGYDARSNYNKEKVYKNSISTNKKEISKLPKLITRNFPQREQFNQIEHKKASDDTLKKALIMLCFYSFFTEAYLKDPNLMNSDLIDEFKTEMNGILEKCGYVQLYWRNPYDWMIGYCIQFAGDGGNPIYRLRDIISDMYLKYTQGLDDYTIID